MRTVTRRLGAPLLQRLSNRVLDLAGMVVASGGDLLSSGCGLLQGAAASPQVKRRGAGRAAAGTGSGLQPVLLLLQSDAREACAWSLTFFIACAAAAVLLYVLHSVIDG